MKFILTIVCTCYLVLIHAQVKDDIYVLKSPRNYDKDPARNANYFELLGNGGLYSLNIDHIFLYRKKFKVSGRGGVSIFPVGYNIEQSYVAENNYIFLPNPHHVEIGPGITLQRKYLISCSDTTTAKWESLWFGMFRLGYRFQRQEDGFFFRFAFTPIFYRKNACQEDSPITNGGKWFWLGAAIGVSY